MGVRTRAVLKRVADGGGMHLPATVETPVERGELVLDLCEAMIDIAAALYNVSSKELREPGRSTIAVTRVRQIAMYVAHVGCGLSMRQVGLGFGRDRTTVAYACHTIEDLRDDEEFDRHIALTERIVRAAFVRREEA